MRKTRQTPKNVKENIMEEEPVIPQALERYLAFTCCGF